MSGLFTLKPAVSPNAAFWLAAWSCQSTAAERSIGSRQKVGQTWPLHCVPVYTPYYSSPYMGSGSHVTQTRSTLAKQSGRHAALHHSYERGVTFILLTSYIFTGNPWYFYIFIVVNLSCISMHIILIDTLRELSDIMYISFTLRFMKLSHTSLVSHVGMTR